MNDWLLFVLASFAVYRVSRMVAEEDGPAFAFRRLRGTFTDAESSIAAGLRCFYCISVWAALLVTVLLVLFTNWEAWLWPIWWFGVAGAAAKIYEFWRR